MVGIPLDRSCLKKMERCRTNRQISKRNRYWSCKLTKSQLPHLQDDRAGPLIPEVFPGGPSRQSSMAQTHWVRERVGVGKQPVCSCVLIEITGNWNPGFISSRALQASISCSEVFQGLPQNIPDCLHLDTELSRTKLSSNFIIWLIYLTNDWRKEKEMVEFVISANLLFLEAINSDQSRLLCFSK